MLNYMSDLQWTLMMYPSSLMWLAKYSLAALQTMYFPLSSGLGTNLMTDEVHSPLLLDPVSCVLVTAKTKTVVEFKALKTQQNCQKCKISF